jgi:SAM-dependent methyltransferase
MPNAAQIESWDGPGGEHWAAEAARYDRMNQRFADRIVMTLDPRPGEVILDVGCGNGALSLAIAPKVTPGGSVTSLDISSSMLTVARARADDARLTNVTFEKGDAQVHALPADSYDALVSRFGVMFFDDPTTAFANLCRALKSGGRLAFTCWLDLLHNEWIMVPAGAALQHLPVPEVGVPGAPGPFSLADPDTVRGVLDTAGFVEVDLQEVTLPMLMGTSVDDTVAFMQRNDMGEALTRGADEATVERAWSAVHEALESHTTDDGVELSGTAWLVTGRRP